MQAAAVLLAAVSSNRQAWLGPVSADCTAGGVAIVSTYDFQTGETPTLRVRLPEAVEFELAE